MQLMLVNLVFWVNRIFSLLFSWLVWWWQQVFRKFMKFLFWFQCGFGDEKFVIRKRDGMFLWIKLQWFECMKRDCFGIGFLDIVMFRWFVVCDVIGLRLEWLELKVIILENLYMMIGMFRFILVIIWLCGIVGLCVKCLEFRRFFFLFVRVMNRMEWCGVLCFWKVWVVFSMIEMFDVLLIVLLQIVFFLLLE